MISLNGQLSFVKSKSGKGLSGAAGSALVVGVGSADGKISLVKALKGSKDLDAALKVFSATKGFEGRAGQCLPLLHHSQGLQGMEGYAHLFGFGVGGAAECFPQNVVAWGGALARELRARKIEQADILLDSLYNPAASSGAKDAPRDFAKRPHPGGIPSREEFLELFALGMLLGVYKFTRYKTKPKSEEKKKPEAPIQLRVLSQLLDEKKSNVILKRVATIAEGVYLTRDLQTTPANDLYPAELARQAQQAGKAAGYNTTVWDEKKLKSEGMNGIMSVGQGSANPPRLIIMEHNASKKNLPTVVLVGKGITFDTGGISIKPAAGMEEMKMDMSGAAAVVGAMYSLAKLGAPVRAIGLVASAENMPSGTATKPGDVYTAYDGQTVEVINTDAEGRLVLSDALSYAKSYSPDCVIDIATLTGAVIVALGNTASGVMGNDGALLDGFRRASEKIGEKVWELPLYEEYKEDMRSKCADYRNSGERTAGSQKGGTFLNFFVQDAYPWIHLDIAGTDIPKGQGAHCPPDVGSGIANRALVEFTSNVKTYFKKAAK